ncbi:DNA recombination protein RmuC [Paenalcaligenes hominis]|uniref:DNA recombination protein RmuC n=1 Tax=Paenalcaligenes hominis TaxID=643674 RepID=A0ABX0WTW3_9BURK|nr:DNA recombination protein RmuC [Paenalcaligenes hominis]NJB66216.1 DNA recombination protein RmuC [Paenalcaligenes hominis]GGE73042.1 DNA recombination protein RmuC [Paenalcaligenes hominis]
MTELSQAIPLLAALVVGAIGATLYWLRVLTIQKQRLHDAQVSRGRLEEQLTAAQTENLRLHNESQRVTTQNEGLHHQLAQLQRENTELTITATQREEHYQDQITVLTQARQQLTKEFENVAHKVFEERSHQFDNRSQTRLDHLLKPFREQIDGFQKRINEVHDATQRSQASLYTEIKNMMDIGLKMSQEATNLTSALKGDSQQRGAWGEAQLQRTLEMSGLIEDAHYEAQKSFKDEQGRTKLTDYIVKLPDNKHLIIDSKITLNAYDRAIAAETPEAYALALKEHDLAVRKHMDDLASKDYTNVLGMRSPSFVLMFMPIEPAYIEALKHNKDLFEYGYRKGVVLVSHTTLIPILRTVANLWMLERSQVEAREMGERAGEVYNQVCVIAERLSRLGASLKTVSNHYNQSVTALAGQQGLYGKVSRFKELSTKVTRDLPDLQPALVDFEAERLELIVQKIDTNPAETEATAK